MVRATLAIAFFLAAAAQSVRADIPAAEAFVESIATDAWAVSNFESSFELLESGLRGEFRISRIELVDTGRVITDVRIDCALLKLTTHGVECARAKFAATTIDFGRQTANGTFSYDRISRTVKASLAGLQIAGGALRLDVHADDNAIAVQFDGVALQLDKSLALATKFNDSLSGYAVAGSADISGTLNLPVGGQPNLTLEASLDSASLANSEGTIAADGLYAELAIDLEVGRDSVTLSLTFDSNSGEVYIEPVYANLSENAVKLQVHEVETPDFSRFDVPRFSLEQQSLLQMNGSAMLQFPVAGTDAPVSVTADVVLGDASVDNLYTSLVQVALAGTLFGSLETEGRVSGRVKLSDSSLDAAALQLQDVILDDSRNRFAIYGINGSLNWNRDEDNVPAPSRLNWGSGSTYNIIVGGGELYAQLGDNDIELLQPLVIETMGGALNIDRLELRDFGSAEAAGVLDASLEPIQLGQLSGAIGWPAFSGTLSGRLPLLTLAANTITVGGTLSANAFDGSIEMSDLRIEQPFSRVPRLQADMTLRNLDLKRLTDAFSFGLIQGRLSADVAGLQLQNWRPVAMDLHIYTPEDDDSRHRISQRAVENLASVGGGGAGAALSSGFLQFFEVFAYDRIGLRCRLANGICAMSGVEAARSGSRGGGYYIVKGRGIPRIDVVGYRDAVSWPRLMQQLSAITRSGAPTVN